MVRYALDMIILSHYQIRLLLAQRESDIRITSSSADLNLSQIEVLLTADGVEYPDGSFLSWRQAETIVAGDNKCFRLQNGQLQEIRAFSETTGWVRTLYPTHSAPTTLVSGLTMHRISEIDPIEDTRRKIQAIKPVGRVLDTATGLGYTAIQAARTAESVLTVEIDPAALDIARQNPWSVDLFNNPHIEIQIGHAWDVLEEQAEGSFSRIIHDPPALSLGGDLYSGDFYRELYRVLTRKGRLFHYVGDPESKSVKRIWDGVLRRLKEAGFSRVEPVRRAYGIVAHR